MKQSKEKHVDKQPKAPKAPKPPKQPKLPREKVVKAEKDTKRKLSPDSLIIKMVGAFVILIIMIFLVGTVSYSVAKDVISEEVKASMAETVSAKGSYLELGLKQVDNQMVEIISMDECAAYYLNPKLDITALTNEQTSAKSEVSARILNMKTISDFVYHVYLISDIATGISTTPATLNREFYAEFVASAEGQQIDAAEQKAGYLGSHPALEQAVTEKEEKFISSEYALSMWRKVNLKTNMILVVDIDKNMIYNALAELDNGKDSYVAFVAPGGKETVYCSSESGEGLPICTECRGGRRISGYPVSGAAGCVCLFPNRFHRSHADYTGAYQSISG